MLFSIGLANDAIKLPMTERCSCVYVPRAAVDGETFRGLGCLDSMGMALLTIVFLWEQFIGNVRDIAEIDITIKGSGTNSPLPFFLFDVYNSVDRNTLFDLCCYFLCVGVVLTELDFRAFRSSLIVGVILCDLSGVVVGPFCCFCAKVFIETMFYFTIDRGWRKAEIFCYVQAGMTGVILSAMVDPHHADRNIVDLLYFPTGGGKTEAYLGLMAFVIANRRLHANSGDSFNRDGGVTAILRYTLRLLTTQQRDRITKMVIAAELIRQKTGNKYGTTPISIGFWVGGGVTPNSFDDLKEDPEDPGKARRNCNLLYKQLLTCPFCGKPLSSDNFYIDFERKTVEVYCSDSNCMFYKYKQNRMPIPVYLVDEEIYSRCPSIILSTVDKFARLPWDVKTNALFGRVNRLCSRDGYVAIGDDHKRHPKTADLPTSSLTPVKSFAPPELIIQDELHLITGPLGTVYGAYETIIEDLCTYTENGRTVRPKYVVSTATIKNAGEQTKCLYGRKNTAQFPPNGFEIGDSFFINEVPVTKDPFRKYVGICANGQSMKTALLRVYAVLLQTSYELTKDETAKEYIDPYYCIPP